MLMTLAWRNVWRNKLRSGIMIAAMIFGLLGALLMVGFVQAMTENMVDNAIRYQTAHLQIHNHKFLLNEELSAWIPEAENLAASIRQQSGVEAVTARQVVDGMLASAASSRGVRINGIRPQDEIRVTDLQQSLVAGKMLTETGRNPILVSRRNADKLNLRLGSKVVLTFTNIDGDVTGAAFRIVGLFKTPASAFDDSNIFVRRSDLARFSGLDQAHEIAIRIADDQQLTELQEKITTLVEEQGVVQNWGEVQPVLAAMTGSMDIANAIVAGVFIAALGFGIINIMMMSVFERTREFGVLMAIGMTHARVLLLIIMESVLLGAVGGLLGLAAGRLMLAITDQFGLPFGAVAEGLGAYGVDAVLYPSVKGSFYLLMFGMVLFTSLVAALYPARQILKKRPSEALAERH
ncbi:MAG: ABC transporter permease [Desulfuromonadales bacterium]|nr:ABC transporter permease [Desulfuromonadales bacterium]